MKLTSTILPMCLATVATARYLTVKTYSDLKCSSPAESITLHNLEDCHQMNTPFRSFSTQSVDQSFIDEGVRILTWSTNDCQHSSVTQQQTFGLSNDDNCNIPFADINEGQQNPFKVGSFQVGDYS